LQVLVTRAQDDAEPLAMLLDARGHQALIDPMLIIESVDGPELDVGGVQALLVTSANGARALAQRTPERQLRVLTVGDASARVAREAGFKAVESAGGDVDDLTGLATACLKPEAGAVLHAGGNQVAGDLGGNLERAGFVYRREVIYEAHPAAALAEATKTALVVGIIGGVLLYSPRTAAIFVELVQTADLATTLESVVAYCLSPTVAENAGLLQWTAIETAAQSDQDALLELIPAPA